MIIQKKQLIRAAILFVSIFVLESCYKPPELDRSISDKDKEAFKNWEKIELENNFETYFLTAIIQSNILYLYSGYNIYSYSITNGSEITSEYTSSNFDQLILSQNGKFYGKGNSTLYCQSNDDWERYYFYTYYEDQYSWDDYYYKDQLQTMDFLITDRYGIIACDNNYIYKIKEQNTGYYGKEFIGTKDLRLNWQNSETYYNSPDIDMYQIGQDIWFVKLNEILSYNGNSISSINTNRLYFESFKSNESGIVYGFDTDNNIYKLQNGNWDIISPPLSGNSTAYNIRDYYVDSKNRLWVIYNNGLFCLEDDSWTDYSLQIESEEHGTNGKFVQSSDGVIYILTDHGIYIFKG